MKLIRYRNTSSDPLEGLEAFFNRALGFGEFPRDLSEDRKSYNVGFRLDVYDDKDNYYVVAELPGVDKKDLDIQLENSVLRIAGSKAKSVGGEDSSVRLFRSITVPEDIQSEGIEAKLVDGLLTLTLPKAEERKLRTITVD